MSIVMTYLATPEAVREHWPLCLPHIERCVREAVRGEYTAEDLFERAVSGLALPFFARDEHGEVVLAGALEQVFYSRYKTVNVVCLSGGNLQDVAADCFEEMKRFASSIGAEYLEASAAPAMARLLGRIGFEPAYQVVRLPLRGNHAEVPAVLAV